LALRDLAHSIEDITSIGLVVGRKLYGGAPASERAVDAGVTRALVEGLHPGRVPVRVAEIIEETPSTKTLRLVSAGGPLFPFRAGQFLTLFLTVDGVRTSRAYSISSPPARSGYLDITVRATADGFVSRYLLEEAAEGDLFEVSGPGGFFYHEPLVDTDDLVFLAGGSGITPFMSMIRQAAELGSDVNITLIYGSRRLDDVIFANELSEAGLNSRQVDVVLVLSEPPDSYQGTCGLLDTETIDPIIGDVKGKTFFMCGPEAMYGLCSESLEMLGVPWRRIKKEASGPPPDIALVEGWPEGLMPDELFSVKIADVRKRFDVRAGEPLLNSLERNGVALDNMCRSGECGVCRAALVEGSVYMPDTVAVRKTDLAYGYIHPCMAYPLSDITIRL
jgi:ferredoxin-NADP reductase